MDLTQSILAKSDQLNADDLLSGPRTFTVKEVRRGDDDQPVSIVLAEFPANRPFKPSKTVVRILAYALGKETDDWPENVRMTLYRDEKVKWAGQEIGGIRVSHLSHIDKQLKVALAESKGKKSLHVVDPLRPDAPTKPAPEPDIVTPSSPGSITAPQLKKLHTMLTKVGITERDEGLAYYTSVIDRPVESSKDLSKNEAIQIIDALEHVESSGIADEPDPTLDPGWGDSDSQA